MNIECPKCQFSQPNDQYCAKCGVDIFKHKKNPSFKTKKFLIHFVTPAAVLILSLIIFNQSKKQNCSPLCLSKLQKSPFKQLISIKKPANDNLLQKPKLILSKKNLILNTNDNLSSRALSSTKKKKIKSKVNKTTSLLKKSNNQNINLIVEARLISLSKSLIKFSLDSSSLKAVTITDNRLKNILIEGVEVLNDFSEKNIQKALSSINLPLKAKGLRLIVLSHLSKNLSENTKLFFEHVNLDQNSLQATKESDTLIAILINVH